MTRNDMLEIMRRRQDNQKRFDSATTQHTIEIMGTKTTNDTKEEETTMTQTTNTAYTEKNSRYYKTEDGKTTRISKAEYEKAKETERWQAEADAEKKAREEKEAADVKATEDAINKKTEKKEAKKDQPKAEKKERKPRKSKDVAFEDEEQAVTLTAKQVDFILHLSDSCFWEQGLDSTLWCDVLCDEIKGQFEGKPMTVGAMISTLCEKGLATRTKEKRENRKVTAFELTIKGKLIAAKVGLK